MKAQFNLVNFTLKGLVTIKSYSIVAYYLCIPETRLCTNIAYNKSDFSQVRP